MKKKKKKAIVKTICVDPLVHKKVEALRKELKRSYSSQVSFILDEYFRNLRGGNDEDEKERE